MRTGWALIALWAVGCEGFSGDGAGGAGASTQASGSMTSAGGANASGSATNASGSGANASGSGAATSGSSAGGGGSGPTLESITVIDAAGAPQTGLTIISNDAAGALLDQTTTDGAGAASLDVPATGSVSMLDHDGLQVTTYYGITDGASVRFIRTPKQAGVNASKSMSVSVSGTHAGVVRYDYISSCFPYSLSFNPPGSGSVSVTGCAGETTLEMMAIGIGTTSPPYDIGEVKVAEAKSVAYSASSVPAFAFPTAPTVGSARATATKPSNVTGSGFRVIGRRNGRPSYSRYIADADTMGFVVQMPTSLFDGFDFVSNMSFSLGGTDHADLAHIEHAAALTGQTISFGATSLSLPLVFAPPDFAGQKMNYSFQGTSFGDAVVITGVQTKSSAYENITHTIVLPPAQNGSAQIPALPSGFDDVAFKPASYLVQTVQNVDVAGVATYDDLITAGWDPDHQTYNESQYIAGNNPP